MKYLFTILEGAFGLIVFILAANIAATNFERILVAGLGLIYVVVSSNHIMLVRQVAGSHIGIIRSVIASIKLVAKPEQQSEIEDVQCFLDKSEKQLEGAGTFDGIRFIFFFLIFLGSLYLIYVSTIV